MRIRFFTDLVQLRADAVGSHQVDGVRVGQMLVFQFLVAGRAGAANHINVEVSHHLLQRDHWSIVSVVLRTKQAQLFAGMKNYQNGTLRLLQRQGVGNGQNRRCAGAVIIGAGKNFTAGAGLQVIIMRAEDHIFVLQLGIRTLQNAGHVLRRRACEMLGNVHSG